MYKIEFRAPNAYRTRCLGVGARAIRYTAFIIANFEPGVEGHTVSDTVGETLTPLIRLPSKH